MQQLHYRIVSIDEDDFSFVVRYFTDEVSEFDLRSDPADPTNPPLRCRTDCNINIWNPDMSEQELHDLIVSYAPMAWLKRKGDVKAGRSKSAPAVRALHQKNRSVNVIAGTEIDITHELAT